MAGNYRSAEREITAKYPGYCRECGKPFAAGDQVLYDGKRCRHLVCPDEEAAGKKRWQPTHEEYENSLCDWA
jgi:hypothetical protein